MNIPSGFRYVNRKSGALRHLIWYRRTGALQFWLVPRLWSTADETSILWRFTRPDSCCRYACQHRAHMIVGSIQIQKRGHMNAMTKTHIFALQGTTVEMVPPREHSHSQERQEENSSNMVFDPTPSQWCHVVVGSHEAHSGLCTFVEHETGQV